MVAWNNSAGVEKSSTPAARYPDVMKGSLIFRRLLFDAAMEPGAAPRKAAEIAFIRREDR